jgi:hypothetical protein
MREDEYLKWERIRAPQTDGFAPLHPSYKNLFGPSSSAFSGRAFPP